MGKKIIYLDHNATTPVAPSAIEAAREAMGKVWGNPSSGHELGKKAKALLENARAKVAYAIGARENEIVFTSGGTESNNAVILGLSQNTSSSKKRIVTTQIEHPSLMNPCLHLLEKGWDVRFVRVDKHGIIDLEDLDRAINHDTLLVSVMLANNETGAIQPIKQVATIAHKKGALVHTDAAQAVGKIPVDVNKLSVDYLTIAGHKLYAPKGIGALFIRNGAPFGNILFGAGQEFGRRPGTEPVPLAAALGQAAELVSNDLGKEVERQTRLREMLFSGLSRLGQPVCRHGLPELTLPNTLYVSFPGLEGGKILEYSPGLMASTGAACHDRSVSISHVLSAMGVTKEVAMGTIRLSIGRGTTEEEIEAAIEAISIAISTLKG